MIGLAALLAALLAGAAPPPRTGTVSLAIRSEAIKRVGGTTPQSFRVDYAASLTWALADRKVCSWGHCRKVCDETLSHRMLSRKLWWQPADGGEPVLAEDTPDERDYVGGVITFDRGCAAVSQAEVDRAANARLRPHQFVEELQKDRPALDQAADDFMARFPGHVPTR